MPPNGRPLLTASMTPDELAVLEDRLMVDVDVLPDGRVVRSCLLRLNEAAGLYVRLYSILAPKGQEQKDSSPFHLSVHQEQADGTLIDVTEAVLPQWVCANEANKPELIGPSDVVRFLTDILKKGSAPERHAASNLLPEAAQPIKFSAPSSTSGQKVTLTSSSLPQAKLH